MTAPIVFLDTETTGLHADRRPWEIAMIRREGDGTDQTRVTIQVAEPDLTTADPKALDIGRFYERHLEYKPHSGADPTADPAPDHFVSEHAAAILVERWTRGAHLIGVVPSFDTETLSMMLRRHHLAPSWRYGPTDMKDEAAGWLRVHLRWFDDGTDTGRADAEQIRNVIGFPRRSDALSRACDVEPPAPHERHTAMGDARWVERWYDALAEDTRVPAALRARMVGANGQPQ